MASFLAAGSREAQGNLFKVGTRGRLVKSTVTCTGTTDAGITDGGWLPASATIPRPRELGGPPDPAHWVPNRSVYADGAISAQGHGVQAYCTPCLQGRLSNKVSMFPRHNQYQISQINQRIDLDLDSNRPPHQSQIFSINTDPPFCGMYWLSYRTLN